MPSAGQVRPTIFTLNPFAPLARGLVFAGLGCAPGTYLYKDSAKESKGNNGTLTNMDPLTDWVWVPQLGRWGTDHDGSNDTIPTPLSASNDTFTFATWANGLSTSHESMAGNGDADPYKTLLVGIYAAQFYAFIGDGTNYDQAYGTLTASADGLHHYTVTRSGSATPIFYQDGKQLSTTGTTTKTSTFTFNVVPVGYRAGTGKRADGCLWNRVLSAAEIAALADPSNAMLKSGGIPLIAPSPRRLWAVGAGGGGGFAGWPMILDEMAMTGGIRE